MDLARENIDYSHIILKKAGGRKPNASASGIGFLFLLYQRQKLQVKLPRLPLPFGVTMFKGNMYMDISLKDQPGLMSKFQELDMHLIGRLHALFDMEVDEIMNSFVSSIKIPLNPAFSPYLRVKLTKDQEQDYTFSLYSSRKDAEGNLIPIDPTCDEEVKDTFPSHSEVATMIELSGVWYQEDDNRFGTTWKLVQAKKFENEGGSNGNGNGNPQQQPHSSSSGYAFHDDDDEDDDEESD